MREKTFRRPSTRQLLEMNGVEIPKRLSQDYILGLFEKGVLDFSGHTYQEAVSKVESLRGNSRLLMFPSSFRASIRDSNLGIKSLDDLMKVDSQKVLREIAQDREVPSALTKEFAESQRILPYHLLEVASKNINVENPPIGFYWVGGNAQVRAVTWLRAIAGAEMEVMKRSGDFRGEVVDRKPYGNNLRVEVNSRTEDEKSYEFSLFRLPMHSSQDLRRYSSWMNISHNSSDPDASYRGGEHNKRANPVILWSSSAVFAFYESMNFISKHPEWKQFRINPFPIPKDEEAIDFVDNLRLRSFILQENEDGIYKLETLNKTEIEKIIGARTGLKSYGSCWRHWGKKDTSYLYKPMY